MSTDINEEDEDMAIAQADAAIQRNHPNHLYRSFSTRREVGSFSTRREVVNTGGDDEVEDMAMAEYSAITFAATQARPSQCRSHRSASFRRQSLGNGGLDAQLATSSRKRRSLNSSDNFVDNQFSDEEYVTDEKYSTTAQSTAETEDEYSSRSLISATDTEERPRKRLSHSSATSSKNSIGPLDPDRPNHHRRRAAFRVPNFQLETERAMENRMELCRKDRNETRRTKASDGRHHARRSMSYTTGLKMGSIISSSMPEEAEPEEAIDIMRLSKSRFERRVLSLPDPNAVRRLSETSLNKDVDFSLGHNGQSALSASLIAASAATRAQIGRFSTTSRGRRCSVMPSIGDHLEVATFDEDNLEDERLFQYGEIRPFGSSCNVPPSIFCHSEVDSRPATAPSINNAEYSYPQPMANESRTFLRPRQRRMALHRDMELDETSMHPFRETAARDSIRSHELRNIEPLMPGQYEFSQQRPPNQTQSLLLNSQGHTNNPHQRYQGLFNGLPETLVGGESRSLYSSEHNQSLTSLNDMPTASLSGLLQELQTTNIGQCTTGEVFPPNLYPGQTQPCLTRNKAMHIHEPIAAAAAVVTENALAIHSLNRTAENLLAHHASTTMMHPEDISGNASVLSEREGLTSILNHQNQLEYLEHGSSMDSKGDDTSFIYDSFDTKTTGVLAVEVSTKQEEHAIRIIQKAIEVDNPIIKNFIQNSRPSTRLILNNPNNFDDVALHLAVRCGSHVALEAILCEDKDSCLIRNSIGHVPLHIAVECGNFAAVTSICNKSPSSARVQCEEGCLPLHEAVSSGADKQDAPQITAMILSSFPEAVNVTTDEGLLPIHLAAMSGFSAGLRTIFAYKFETMYSRESTEMMLPLDFAVDGLNSEKGDAPHEELLSVAHQQPSSSQQKVDLNSFESCIEILLASTFYNRPVLLPRDESSMGIPFLPLHGALAARPLQRTWKCLVSLYAKDHIKDIDEFGRNIAHYICSKIIEYDEHCLSMLKEIHQTEPSLFAQADESGFIPLHLCLLNKKSPPYELVKAVVNCYPSALTVEVHGKVYRGFLPFQVAAISGCDENVIMYLLRNHPMGVQSIAYNQLRS